MNEAPSIRAPLGDEHLAESAFVEESVQRCCETEHIKERPGRRPDFEKEKVGTR